MTARLTRLFPVWAVGLSVVAYLYPQIFVPAREAIVPLLGVVMFGMGLTLTTANFAEVLRRPAIVGLGVALQFGIMPLAAWLIALLLGLPPQLGAGLILVGCCPGGTASNVICYLARGDVALSITLTAVSTLLAVLVTPLLTLLYAGQTVPVPVLDMLLSIVRIILLPVALGVLVNHFLHDRLAPVRGVFPVISVLAIVVIIAIIVVHAFYVSVVRPNAAQIIEEQNAAAAADPDYVRERRVAVLIKDLEQEACFILMFWALAIMGYKAVRLNTERKLLDVDLIPVPEGMRILPEDTREFARQVQALPEDRQQMLLPRALLNALRRFSTTRNIQDVSSSTRDIFESEAERLESELSMIRYISWAIPSIGFIGTVRGIGEALAQADKAVQGDIAGVTMSLGVAFNSTFIALLISIFLMFLVYQLQLMQERLVYDSETYCDDKVIRHLKAD